MNGREIVEMCWHRDERALACLEESCGALCRRVALHILGSREDAEECVSDAWMKVWNAIPPQRPDRLEPFVVRIVRNAALDRLRCQSAERRGGGQAEISLHELEACVAGTREVEDELMAQELARSVGRFVRGLPARERRIFTDRYFFLEPAADIARKEGLSAGHVKVILSRTRKKIRKHLQKEGWME